MVTADGSDDAYERHKRRAAQRQADLSQEAREIGPLPKVEDAARKEACRNNLRLFLETYAAGTFNLEWSEDHLKVIAIAQRLVLEGGAIALAMARGSGKTSLLRWVAIWALVYGHRHFLVIVCATGTLSKQLLRSFKSTFETETIFTKDFPEVCYPIQRLEGLNQRAAGQTLYGKRTAIAWTGAELVFPTVDGSAASAAIVRVASMGGGIRGMQAESNGETIRPDIVLCDDPQTDKSAKSVTQTQDREDIIKGTIMGLAGPDQTIACMVPCTVIYEDDLAERLLDPERSPEFESLRFKLLKSMPERLDLWEQYRELRKKSLIDRKDISMATEYYAAHRHDMERGCVPSWPARYNKNHISAIQFAMDLWAKDARSFFAEYQQEPKKDEVIGSNALRAHEVAQRFTGLRRGHRPDYAGLITIGMDIQQDVIFWLAMGWDKGSCRGHVIDYGAWPEQPKAYFTLLDLRQTLRQRYKASTDTEGLIHGLGEIVGKLLDRSWPTMSGIDAKADLVVCDANWAPSTDIVYDLARVAGPRFLPYHGRYIGAVSQPMELWKKEPGDRDGPGWRVATGKRRQRNILADINAWKSRVADWLRTPDQTAGIWLPGTGIEANQMFADHCASEYPVPVAGRGRSLDEWKQRPGRDNHWFDCLISAAVAASIQGFSTPGAAAPVVRRVVSYREQQLAKRAGR